VFVARRVLEVGLVEGKIANKLSMARLKKLAV
jgi:hypothetical protein